MTEFAGKIFKHLGFIGLQKEPDGSPILDNPQDGLTETECHKKLTPPFCRLDLPELPKVPGVYVVMLDGKPMYVGNTKNLYERWHSGYKVISEAKCKHNGQATNWRINHLILEARNQGQRVGLLFYEYETLERRVVAEQDPPWNRPYSTG